MAELPQPAFSDFDFQRNANPFEQKDDNKQQESSSDESVQFAGQQHSMQASTQMSGVANPRGRVPSRVRKMPKTLQQSSAPISIKKVAKSKGKQVSRTHTDDTGSPRDKNKLSPNPPSSLQHQMSANRYELGAEELGQAARRSGGASDSSQRPQDVNAQIIKKDTSIVNPPMMSRTTSLHWKTEHSSHALGQSPGVKEFNASLTRKTCAMLCVSFVFIIMFTVTAGRVGSFFLFVCSNQKKKECLGTFSLLSLSHSLVHATSFTKDT